MTGGRVVVLGRTGRNFAAGMSGGIAYVLDEHGASRSAATWAWSALEALDEADALELRALIAEHGERTGSPVGQPRAREWDELLPGRFVKVMPHDYKRVLARTAPRKSASRRAPPRTAARASSRELESRRVPA